MHLPVGCLVKYIIAKYTEMSNNKTGLCANRDRSISPERYYIT
nr:MAG TPA: hypothetical protein [Bacteriophage sp.]